MASPGPVALVFVRALEAGDFEALERLPGAEPPLQELGLEPHSYTTMARARRKSELPTKVCVACGRPFAWRRKWARDWESVRYCSKRCRRERA